MPDNKHVVLVVTDDEHVRSEVTFGFPEDVEVVLALDSREATKKMFEVMPSAVVIEIRTGSAGGIGLLRDMRQQARLKDVPVFMLLERMQDQWLAVQAGASDTCVQPVEITELVDRVLALLPRDQAA